MTERREGGSKATRANERRDAGEGEGDRWRALQLYVGSLLAFNSTSHWSQHPQRLEIE